MSDWMLSQGTVEFRQEERNHALGRYTDRVPSPQTPACDRCSVGVMDATNPHLWGDCDCACHGENPRYGPGNPDWEHDREREDAA